MKLTKAQRAWLTQIADSNYYDRIIIGTQVGMSRRLRAAGAVSIDIVGASRWSHGIATITDAGRAALEQGS